MGKLIDNFLALRIIYLLTVPIETTDAFKLGLIDANGGKLKDAKTPEERASTSMLHRLVWNIKKVFNLVPGGKTRLGSLAAAYLLVKEQVEARHTEVEAMRHFNENFDRVWGLPFMGKELVEDALEALQEDLQEDAPGNVAGAGVQTDTPVKPAVTRAKIVRRFAEFSVDDETFGKFKNGKSKYRKWAEYLNLEDAGQRQIYEFAKKNPTGIIVLKDQKGSLKGIRYSRVGSGNWANIKRKALSEDAIMSFSEKLLAEHNEISTIETQKIEL